MKNKEICNLFPKQFYCKEGSSDLYAEITLNNLSKIIDYIVELESKGEK